MLINSLLRNILVKLIKSMASFIKFIFQFNFEIGILLGTAFYVNILQVIMLL